MSSPLARSEYVRTRVKRMCLALLVPLFLVVTALGIAGCITPANVPKQPATPTSTPPATPTTTTPIAPPLVRPVPPTSTAPLASATPEDAMRAWYRAWFAGDILAAQRTSTTQFASTIDLNTFEGGDVIDYKVLGSEGAAGTIAFYISETREEASGKTAMTVFVTAADSGKGYLVKGYEATPPGTVPAEKVADSKTAVSEADARAAVTGALQALQAGAPSTARDFATARFVAANPKWFTPAESALVEFSVSRTARRHDVWLIQIKETWHGEPDPFFVNFLVSDVGGTAKIDRVEGWY